VPSYPAAHAGREVAAFGDRNPRPAVGRRRGAVLCARVPPDRRAGVPPPRHPDTIKVLYAHGPSTEPRLGSSTTVDTLTCSELYRRKPSNASSFLDL
jgi:hypothetical protein